MKGTTDGHINKMEAEIETLEGRIRHYEKALSAGHSREAVLVKSIEELEKVIERMEDEIKFWRHGNPLNGS